jgi:acyl-CoA thioesterase-1
MNWSKLILLLLLIAGSPAGADAPVLLVVGDSLSAGYGLAKGESWVDLLQQRLQKSGLRHRVVNASISGDTTRGGLARLPRSLKIHQPQLVIIELGGNDGLRAIPIEEIRRNLTRMIRLSREAGAEVLLAGIRIPPNYGPDYTARFQESFAVAAAAAGARLTPFILQGVALEPGMMQADGIHPSAAAQPMILDNVWPDLCALLLAHDDVSDC